MTVYEALKTARQTKSPMAHEAIFAIGQTDAVLLQHLTRNKTISKQLWFKLFESLKPEQVKPLIEHDLNDQQIWAVLSSTSKTIREQFFVAGITPDNETVSKIADLPWVDPPLSAIWYNQVLIHSNNYQMDGKYWHKVIDARSSMYDSRYWTHEDYALTEQWMYNSRRKRLAKLADDHRPGYESDRSKYELLLDDKLDKLGIRSWTAFMMMLGTWEEDPEDLFQVIKSLDLN